LDRHLRPWLESFGCIGGRHEMKRSHAQRSNFKVIGSERISTFRKDCTGSRGRDFVLSVGTGADANDILLEAVIPEPATVGVLFDGAYLGVGMLLHSRSHARRSPAGAFPAGSDFGSRPWTWCTANGKVTLRFLHGDPSITYTDGQVSPSVSA
jgi:hypothetical protein